MSAAFVCLDMHTTAATAAATTTICSYLQLYGAHVYMSVARTYTLIVEPTTTMYHYCIRVRRRACTNVHTNVSRIAGFIFFAAAVVIAAAVISFTGCCFCNCPVWAV